MKRRRYTPQEKKRMAYLRDYYNRGGESHKAWRKTKPRKKRKAMHAYRRKLRVQLLKLEEGEDSGLAVGRGYSTVRQEKVCDWGPIRLREYVRREGARSQVPRLRDNAED